MNPNEKLTALLTGKNFKHDGNDFAFVSCKTVVSNLMILTNKKTIQVPVDRFVDFYQKVEANCYVPQDENVAKELLKQRNFGDVSKKEHVHQAEIIKVNGVSARITEKLEAVFDLLAENPNEETYKKAKAMVDASNAIVNVQMANYKFLTLK